MEISSAEKQLSARRFSFSLSFTDGEDCRFVSAVTSRSRKYKTLPQWCL